MKRVAIIGTGSGIDFQLAERIARLATEAGIDVIIPGEKLMVTENGIEELDDNFQLDYPVVGTSVAPEIKVYGDKVIKRTCKRHHEYIKTEKGWQCRFCENKLR